VLIIARSLRPRLSLVSELTTAHDSGHDYYFHGRDGRVIDLLDPRLLLVCLIIFASVII
jgi:hypothetical protein